MFEFLVSLILFAFGLGHIGHPALDPITITERVQEQIFELPLPQADSVESQQRGQTVSENEPDLPDQAENSREPNTNKVRAFNTSSGNVIESVAAVAVEKAPPLIPCTHPDATCTPPPTPTPIPAPSPTPIELPDPLPCVVPPPCVYQKPACFIYIPAGGWCPYPKPLPDPCHSRLGDPEKPQVAPDVYKCVDIY